MKIYTALYCHFPALLVLILNITSVSAADIYNGRKVYDNNCQTCHGPAGRGLMPGTPNFTRGAGLIQPDLVLLSGMRSGKTTQGSIHPAFRGILSEKEMLDVISHLRTYLK